MSHEAYQQPGPLFGGRVVWGKTGPLRLEYIRLLPTAEEIAHGLPPAQPHSPTSIAAAEAIKPHAVNLREAVYAALSGAVDGLTDEEGCTLLKMNPSTYRPRRIDLVHEVPPRVRDSGRTRCTAAGRQAVVWEVFPA